LTYSKCYVINGIPADPTITIKIKEIQMKNNPDDLNKRLVKRIKKWLKTEIKQYKSTYELVDEKHIDDPYKEIHFGRKECAIGLKRMISIWEKELK
tara:strand:- start:71 stop:358 length:288 start_codon:yes stop_codon:yes gene_type:complete